MDNANLNPTGANTVVLGCRLPNGVILEVGKVGEEDYQRYELNGAKMSRIEGGAGFTTIPAKFWAAWNEGKAGKRRQRLAFIRNGLVFAASTVEEANAQAMDRMSTRTGFERLDPKKAPKGLEVNADAMKASKEALQQLRS